MSDEPGWYYPKTLQTLSKSPSGMKRFRAYLQEQKLAPADVTRMVLWLAADDSRMCTAQLWVVDAGRM